MDHDRQYKGIKGFVKKIISAINRTAIDNVNRQKRNFLGCKLDRYRQHKLTMGDMVLVSVVRWWKLRTTTVMMTDIDDMIIRVAKYTPAGRSMDNKLRSCEYYKVVVTHLRAP